MLGPSRTSGPNRSFKLTRYRSRRGQLISNVERPLLGTDFARSWGGCNVSLADGTPASYMFVCI